MKLGRKEKFLQGLRDFARSSPRPRPEATRDLQSWVELGEISPTFGAYRKTFEFPDDFIDSNHRRIATAPMGRLDNPLLIDLGIDGFLSTSDALKIYEMAYFSEGDVLELGTHRGLSTSIIASALDAKRRGRIATVDLDQDAKRLASKNIKGKPGARRVSFMFGDAAEVMDRLIAKRAKFGFIFVDHWHGYDATRDAAERSKQLLLPGGFILFHDYTDLGNADPNHPYGVYQAVRDVIVADPRFEFYCVSGCCGLFRFSG
jgi:predicted O-methyltransferase YrrM